MKYEVRNQYGNVPYVDGVKEAVVGAVMEDATELTFCGSNIRILSSSYNKGVMVINIFIEEI